MALLVVVVFSWVVVVDSRMVKSDKKMLVEIVFVVYVSVRSIVLGMKVSR